MAKNNQRRSSAGRHSLSALVSLWALKCVNPYTQSYLSLSEELIPCQNSTQKSILHPTHIVSSHWNDLHQGVYISVWPNLDCAVCTKIKIFYVGGSFGLSFGGRENNPPLPLYTDNVEVNTPMVLQKNLSEITYQYG